MTLKYLLPILLCLSFLNNLSAQPDRVFGINWDIGEVRFTSVNINTGSVDILSDPINADYIWPGVSDFDPIEKRYFYLKREGDEEMGVISLDASNGELISDVQLDLPETTGANPFVFISHLGYNWMDEKLYGILLQREEVGEGLIYLVTIDENTGAVDFISNEPIDEIPVIASGNSDIDPVNRRFIYVTEDRIYTIDLDTGEAIHSPMINYPPATELQYAANTTYDYQNDIIYCLHYLNVVDANGVGQFGDLRLASIDPVNGDLTIISTERISKDGFTSGDCDIDPALNRFLYIRQDTLHVVRLSDGIELSKVSIQNIDDTFTPLVNMAYDDLSVIDPAIIPMDMGNNIFLNTGESLELNVWLGDDVFYLWNDGSTDAIRNVSTPGIYTVTITRGGFTIEGSITIEVGTTSNENLAGDIIFEINPNPASEFLQYKIENLEQINGILSIMDIKSKNLWSKSIQNNIGQINLNSFANGTYFLKYETAAGLRIIKKIVIQK